MPPRQKRQAKGIFLGKDIPESVDDFLGGFSVMTDRSRMSREQGEIAVNLRLMNKNSEVTKQKSLKELIGLVKEAPIGAVTEFVVGIVETILRHTQDPNPTIRVSVFELLEALMGRGKEVKVCLVSSLPALSPVWVMSMNEMESAVRAKAQAAFELAFSAEKRGVMLVRYKDAILSGIFDVITEIVDKNGTPLRDDTLDSRSNSLFSALCGLGYMAKQVSASQDRILSYVLENPGFVRLLPGRPGEKKHILNKTPLVRSSVLSLLRDVVTVCPSSTKLHELVIRAIQGSIQETIPTLAARVWELMLFWCHRGIQDVVDAIPSNFFNDVIESFMLCNQQELAEVIFPSLLPLLIQLTSEGHYDDMLDEFVRGLLEKMRQLKNLPNASARELVLAFAALTECWGLYCIRKRGGETAFEKSRELFKLIVSCAIGMLGSETERARYLTVMARSLGLSLLKISHSERIFRECMNALCQPLGSNAAFVRDSTPCNRVAEMPVNNHWQFCCAVLESMYSKAVEDTRYTSRQTVLSGYLDTAVLQMLLECANAPGLVTLLVAVSNKGYCPSPEVAQGVLQHLFQLLETLDERSPSSTENSRAGAVADEELTGDCEKLIETAFLWNIPDFTCSLLERLKRIRLNVVQRAIMRFHLRDPNKAFELLLSACVANSFADIDHCLAGLNEADATLTPSQRSAVLEAVVAGLESALRSVGGMAGASESLNETHLGHASGQPRALQSCANDGSDGEGLSPRSRDSKSSNREADDGTTNSQDESGTGGSITNSESSSQEDRPSEANELGEKNKANEVFEIVTHWCERLSCDNGVEHAQRARNIGSLLCLSCEVFTQRISQLLYRIVAALAPRLYPEGYISIKALRVVLQGRPRDGDEDADEHAPVDRLRGALEQKTCFLKVNDFGFLVEHVASLLDCLKVPVSERDTFAEKFLVSVLKFQEPTCYDAVHQLQFLVPFASKALLQRLAESPALWQIHAIPLRSRDCGNLAVNTGLLFGGYFSLTELDLSLSRVVRMAQLVRLLDYSNAVESWDEVTSDPNTQPRAQVFYHLIAAASVREIFPSGIQSILFSRLLPKAFAFIGPLSNLLINCSVCPTREATASECKEALVCTLAVVLRDRARGIDDSQHLTFLLQARRVVSAITERVVGRLFTREGARGIERECCVLYIRFYAIMDEIANILEDNIFAQIPNHLETLFLEASCMLPSWDLDTAKLSLVVHRHLSTMPAVMKSTVKSLLAYAQRQNPLQCVELLAELSCTRILDLEVFTDLVRVMTHSLCRCYTLRHLPSNGRLPVASPGSAPEPLPFEILQRIAVAAVMARRGVVLHSCTEDVLRSTVNLVIFDSVCEAVSRLRTTSAVEMPLLAKLIAFTSDFMRGLLHNDTAVLRASDATVMVIASALSYVYLWLNATPIAKIEGIGYDVVAGVLQTVCLVSNLTLVRARAPLRGKIRLVLNKWSLKPLRHEFFSASPLKLSELRRHNTVIGKTHKQKLLIFPYLLSWCVMLTTPAIEEEIACSSDSQGSKQWRNEVSQLLDLLCVLLLTPLFAGAKRVEDTFLGTASSIMKESDSSNVEVGTLGFEVVALTRVMSPYPLMELARGAAAVFCLLLRGPTLWVVKLWLETVERKVQTMLYNFVQLYISPLLIQENLLTVLSHSSNGTSTFTIGEQYSVAVRTVHRTIDLSYAIEDARVSVRISFPNSYPLRQPTVEFVSGRESGISIGKRRLWMLRMTSMLFSQTTNLWDCMELFRQNVEAHLGGQEPCPICYAIVSAVNHKLPDLQCSVCRNLRFHSSCLYTWWASGGQTVCPLCRSPWISE